MTGVCGWYGAEDAHADAVVDAMRGRITWAGESPRHVVTGPAFGLGAVGPVGAAGAFDFGTVKIAFHGHGCWGEAGSPALAPEALCRRFAEAYRDEGPDALARLGGDFALALIDLDRRQALLAIDRSGIRNVVYRVERGVLVFAANLDALAAHPRVTQRVDPQALYNYVYFHTVPGPGTVFERSERLLPGHYALARGGDVLTKPYWEMQFTEDERRATPDLAREFHAALRAGVEAFGVDPACGTFLSGGTDSSTVTGVLSKRGGNPVRTYSIGFDAEGYDEMAYARIAARHFATDHHEYYVTPSDVVAAIPVLAAEYDQPFGNASAVPTYYCARLARSGGVSRMLAGDGGDELFGGNVRYAKQYQLALYERVPPALRAHVIEPLLRSGIAGAVPLLRKGRSYVDQARLPMPARYEGYNLLQRVGPETLFDREFLAAVDPGAPHSLLAAVHDAAHARSLINRMLAIDLKFTLADSDLPKVTRMCDRAGVDVAFPLLHESVVAFSTILPPRLKLRGTRLRYFFKQALKDFLPPEIIAKKKHGFGLPAGAWLAGHPPLHALARDALASLRQRRIFRADYLDALLATHLHQHPAYYGTLVWVLMMLELWFQAHVDRGAARGDAVRAAAAWRS
jgi:asparagine synthase (glutamine-hydrolysing)